MRSYKQRQSPISFVMSVRPSVCALVSARLRWTDFVRVDTGFFYENLSSNFLFDQNRTTISGALHADLSKVNLLTVVRNNLCSQTMQREPILAFPWQHSAVLYCW